MNQGAACLSLALVLALLACSGENADPDPGRKAETGAQETAEGVAGTPGPAAPEAVPPPQSSVPPLTEAQARALLVEASAADPSILRSSLKRHRFGQEEVDKVIAAVEASCPLTLAVFVVIPKPENRDVVGEDIRFQQSPRTVLGRLVGLDPVDMFQWRLGPDTPRVSFLNDRSIQSLSLNQQGSRADGEVRFGEEGFYAGRVLYEARYEDGNWSVVALRMPKAGLALHLKGDAWRVDPSTIGGWTFD